MGVEKERKEELKEMHKKTWAKEEWKEAPKEMYKKLEVEEEEKGRAKGDVPEKTAVQ